MLTVVKSTMIIWLIVGVQAAVADETGDAVQVLSKLWKGTFDSSTKGHVTTEFVGDAKNFKMRWTAYQSDGTVAVLDGGAPFRFLEIADDSLNNLVVGCVPESECIYVRCLYKRDCVSVRQVTYDPVYRDPKYQSITLFQRPEASGAVKPADAESVRQALGTLIRLNAAPAFEPPAPR
jgi:hypothetical protein